MGLIESLSWAVVELQGEKPDMRAVKQAIDAAFVEAAKLNIHHDVRKDNYIRLVAATGGY